MQQAPRNLHSSPSRAKDLQLWVPVPQGEICLGKGSPPLSTDIQQKNGIICVCWAGTVLGGPGPSHVSWAEGPCRAPVCAGTLLSICSASDLSHAEPQPAVHGEMRVEGM